MTPKFIIGIVLIALLSGCYTTQYSKFGEQNTSELPIGKIVRYDIQDKFFRNPPDCIAVMPVSGYGPPDLKRLVAKTVARHLMQKVPRVISPSERNMIAVKQALDLSDKNDREVFIEKAKCSHFAQLNINKVDDTYALVWASKSIGISIKIVSNGHSIPIWQAAHLVSRGDGGLPLSPFSIGAAMVKAGISHGETDTYPSMVDDCVRKMFIKFPDIRLL